MKDISLLQADFESEKLGSLCKAESEVLPGSFGVGNESSVVSEEEVTEQLLKCFCVGMQSPEVKQTVVKTVANVYSTVIIKVFYDLIKHHAEKDAEQSRCQNTTPFYAVDNGEGSTLFNLKWRRWSFCNWITILRNFGGQPMHSMIIHSPVLLTVSNALVKRFASSVQTLAPN